VAFDNELGIILPYVDFGKKDTILKQLFKLKEKKEILSEKVRVLYVALTRAKEKMIFIDKIAKARESGFVSFKDFLYDTGLTMYAEGHQGAFGVGVLDENFANFISTINLLLSEVSFERLYKVDFIIDANELTGDKVLELANWRELWGQNINEPLIAIRGVNVNQSNLRFIGAGGKTMRIDLPQDKISFIKFFMKDDEIDELMPPENGRLTLDVIGTFQKNSYNGFTSPQIQIEDYEITKRVDYYF
jgi:single-stranded-DNA-specific exonuclease